MVKPLEEDREDVIIKIDELISLEDAGIADADLAHRELDQEHLETLILSNPRTWPAILITKTDRGYVIIDGYHRREAAIDKKLDEIKATSQTYTSEQEIVEATFRANLTHGLKASAESRSNYAYWLHKTFPKMLQKDIAEKCGIKQSSVSIAIARREAVAGAAAKLGLLGATTGQVQAEAKKQKEGEIGQKASAEEQHAHALRTCRNLTRDALRLFQDIDTLDRKEQREIVIEALTGIGDREKLLRVAQLLEEILQPKGIKRGAKK
jgi:ParB-like chromosome segregation protein Spo0J